MQHGGFPKSAGRIEVTREHFVNNGAAKVLKLINGAQLKAIVSKTAFFIPSRSRGVKWKAKDRKEGKKGDFGWEKSSGNPSSWAATYKGNYVYYFRFIYGMHLLAR